MSSAAELAIRLNRAAFNRALADGDLNAIGPLLAPDMVMITGSDSAVINGRKAQLIAWRREFASPQRMIYTRTTETVLLSPVEPIAMEHGRWQGSLAMSGAIMAAGAYSAKWRQIGGAWVIEAEIYLTLA